LQEGFKLWAHCSFGQKVLLHCVDRRFLAAISPLPVCVCVFFCKGGGSFSVGGWAADQLFGGSVFGSRIACLQSYFFLLLPQMNGFWLCALAKNRKLHTPTHHTHTHICRWGVFNSNLINYLPGFFAKTSISSSFTSRRFMDFPSYNHTHTHTDTHTHTHTQRGTRIRALIFPFLYFSYFGLFFAIFKALLLTFHVKC